MFLAASDDDDDDDWISARTKNTFWKKLKCSYSGNNNAFYFDAERLSFSSSSEQALRGSWSEKEDSHEAVDASWRLVISCRKESPEWILS